MSLFAGLEAVPFSLVHHHYEGGDEKRPPAVFPEKRNMHSPLPDSSALEAGIIEDERPSRLSRVQDNVRHLLRTSVFGSVASSPTTPTHAQRGPVDHLSAMPSPLHYETRTEVLPSPNSTMSGSTDYSGHIADVADVAMPSEAHTYPAQQHMAHQSVYDARAIAALNHPDLSDLSMTHFEEQKARRRQQRCWKRSRHGKRKRAAKKAAGSQVLLCLLAALLLGALVATYLALAMNDTKPITATFHILFVLAILLATILFAHTIIRLCVTTGSQSRPRALLVDVSRHGRPPGHHYRHRHPRGHGRHQTREPPMISADAEAYVPPTPIPVHVSSDEVRADEVLAQPSAVPEPDSPAHDWDKEVHTVTNPPPAYGRWRGSVRANPDLLHWQAVPSPTTPDTPALPSPTYEAALGAAHDASPPSYMTRESPARQREMRDARAGVIRSQFAEPEMVEARGAGVVGTAM